MRVLMSGMAVRFVKRNGVLHALEDKCPHQGKSFEGGTCKDGFLVCPHHKMSFDPATGRNRYGMTENVRVFPVEEHADGVRIGLPAKGFSLFGLRLW